MSRNLASIMDFFAAAPKAIETKQVTNALTKTFSQILTKGGKRQEAILARVNSRLKLKYQVDNPIQLAITACKPIVRFKKTKPKRYEPIALTEKIQMNLAIKWIIECAYKREYDNIKDLERGLFDEVVSVLDGSSKVYEKRFNMHKSPTQWMPL